MLMENYIGRTLTFEELRSSPQTCVSQDEVNIITKDSNIHSVKDYTTYLIVTSVYMAIIAAVFAVFFRTQQKRSDVDNDIIAMSSIEDADATHTEQVLHIIIVVK